MMVWELIELLKKAPSDDIVFAGVRQGVYVEISGVVATSDVLIGDDAIEGITRIETELF